MSYRRFLASACLLSAIVLLGAAGCGDAPSNAAPTEPTQQELQDYTEQMRKAQGGR